MKIRHYSSEQWVDYLRDAAPENARVEMSRHLAAGCKKCSQAVGVWTTILKLARQEPGFQPPDSAVHMAQSYFALCPAEAKESMVNRVARLVFDSFRQPQLEGVRSLGSSPRHYVYQRGSMMVDIWLDPPNDFAPVPLTGQIFDKSRPNQAVRDMSVKLRSGDGDIFATRTNQFGEFHLEIGPACGADLQLTIGEDDHLAVLVPLLFVQSAQAGRNR